LFRLKLQVEEESTKKRLLYIIPLEVVFQILFSTDYVRNRKFREKNRNKFPSWMQKKNGGKLRPKRLPETS